MAEQFFYQNRITQSDYRGGATNAPRKHALYLESQLPKLAFKTKKGKETFLNQLYEYVTHFIHAPRTRERKQMDRTGRIATRACVRSICHKKLFPQTHAMGRTRMARHCCSFAKELLDHVAFPRALPAVPQDRLRDDHVLPVRPN